MTQQKYAHAVIATDVAVFTIEEGELKTLLIAMKKKPFSGKWAFPGGLVRADEPLDASALRQLQDKTGVRNIFLEQLASFGDPKRDPFGRVVSVAYFALIPIGTKELKTSEEYGGVAWFPVTKIPSLAYDHHAILDVALSRLRAKLAYTNIVCSLMPTEFTFSELQKVYEIILGKTLDKRNFRKKIEQLGLLTPTKGKREGGAYRPAQLYKFSSRTPRNIEML